VGIVEAGLDPVVEAHGGARGPVEGVVAAVVRVRRGAGARRLLGDDVDDAAHRHVAPQAGGAAAADHLDALDGVLGNLAPVDRAKVGIVHRHAVDHHQRVDGRAGAEAADVERLGGRMELAGRDGEVPDARDLVDDLVDAGLGHRLDLLARHDRRADVELFDISAFAGTDRDRRQHCRGLGRCCGWRVLGASQHRYQD
jgi:hypothetical protein